MDFSSYHSTLGYKELNKRSHGKQFLSKILVDVELTDGSKKLFFDHLKSYRIDFVIEDYCYDFFHKNQFLGTPLNDLSIEFVRIIPYELFFAWINEIIAADMELTLKTIFDTTLPISEREFAFEMLLESKIKVEILNNPNECSKFLGDSFLPDSVQPELREAKLARYAMWSFPIPASEPDIFEKDKLKDLDCRAGLTRDQKKDKAVFTHSVQNVSKITKPTVYDAEFYDQFLPGGRTIPLSACFNLQGFDEYFHLPNKFKDILDKFALIIK